MKQRQGHMDHLKDRWAQSGIDGEATVKLPVQASQGILPSGVTMAEGSLWCLREQGILRVTKWYPKSETTS